MREEEGITEQMKEWRDVFRGYICFTKFDLDYMCFIRALWVYPNTGLLNMGINLTRRLFLYSIKFLKETPPLLALQILNSDYELYENDQSGS